MFDKFVHKEATTFLIEGRFPSWLRDTQKVDNHVNTDVHITNFKPLQVQSIHKTDFGVFCPITSNENILKMWSCALDTICNKLTKAEIFGLRLYPSNYKMVYK